MTNTRKLLMAKARGFTISVDKLEGAARLSVIRGEYAADYNRLVEQAKVLLPTIEPLLPPKIETYRNGDTMFGDATFHVVGTYCEQIFQLLAECADPKGGG